MIQKWTFILLSLVFSSTAFCKPSTSQTQDCKAAATQFAVEKISELNSVQKSAVDIFGEYTGILGQDSYQTTYRFLGGVGRIDYAAVVVVENTTCGLLGSLSYKASFN